MTRVELLLSISLVLSVMILVLQVMNNTRIATNAGYKHLDSDLPKAAVTATVKAADKPAEKAAVNQVGVQPTLPPPQAPQQPAMPSGALIVRAPGMARWQITFTSQSTTAPGESSAPPQGKDAPRPAPEIKQINVTKTGNTYYREVVMDDGSGIDAWWVGGAQVTMVKGRPELWFGQGGGDRYYVSYSDSDFPEFNWAGVKTYDGLEKVGDRVFIVFKNQIPRLDEEVLRRLPPAALEDATKDTLEAKLWVDLGTRLPARFATAEKKETVTYLPEPSGPIVVPPAVQSQLAAMEKMNEDANKHSPRP